MFARRIVEPGLATHFEMNVPADDRDASDDFVRLFVVLIRAMPGAVTLTLARATGLPATRTRTTIVFI